MQFWGLLHLILVLVKQFWSTFHFEFACVMHIKRAFHFDLIDATQVCEDDLADTSRSEIAHSSTSRRPQLAPSHNTVCSVYTFEVRYAYATSSLNIVAIM
jgi:hypothetical protein